MVPPQTPKKSGEVVELWCTFYHQPTLDESLLATYRQLMTEGELSQAARFYFERDRRRYIITRALVRTVLSRYAEDVSPKEWRFENNPYGRPHIVNDSAAARSLSFNITHTDGLIVLAVARENTLGVDAENTQTRPVSTSLADSFFAPEEAAALRTVDAASWQQRFFEYWTLKESYIKARGMGLSIPLDQFSFSFPENDAVGLYVHPEQNDPAERWRFWQFTLAPSYTVALCVGRQSGEAPSLIVKDAVPLVSENDLSYSLVRSSR
jgi:4'-phosphopantetheinyl transferase